MKLHIQGVIADTVTKTKTFAVDEPVDLSTLEGCERFARVAYETGLHRLHFGVSIIPPEPVAQPWLFFKPGQ